MPVVGVPSSLVEDVIPDFAIYVTQRFFCFRHDLVVSVSIYFIHFFGSNIPRYIFKF